MRRADIAAAVFLTPITVSLSVVLANNLWWAVFANSPSRWHGWASFAFGIVFAAVIFVYYYWPTLLVIVVLNGLLLLTLKSNFRWYRRLLFPVNLICGWVLSVYVFSGLGSAFDSERQSEAITGIFMEPFVMMMGMVGGLVAALCWYFKVVRFEADFAALKSFNEEVGSG